MQAITLWQPWATLIALGLKRIETRPWPAPKVDGDGPASQLWRPHGLAIHSARHTPGGAMHQAFMDPLIRQALAYHGITETNWTGQAGSLPQGAIVAVVTLGSCALTELVVANLIGLERAAGNYQPGRWAWCLKDVINLNDLPQAATGRQRVWTVPLHVVACLNLAADKLDRLPAGGFQ